MSSVAIHANPKDSKYAKYVFAHWFIDSLVHTLLRLLCLLDRKSAKLFCLRYCIRQFGFL